MKSAKLVMVLVLCLVCGNWAFGQVEALPKGAEILERYIEATGGTAAYEKIHNVVAKMTLEIPMQGFSGSLVQYAAKPNKALTVVDLGEFGKMERGTNGKVAWELNPMAGPRLIEGKEKVFMMREATFHKELHWRKLYKKIECVGMETIQEKKCYKVELTPMKGEKETQYFDKEKSLLVKQVVTQETQMGPTKTEFYFEDYKKVGGILLPHKIKQAGMMEVVITVLNIQQNVEMPKDRFDVPAEIKPLLPKTEEGGIKESEGGPIKKDKEGGL